MLKVYNSPWSDITIFVPTYKAALRGSLLVGAQAPVLERLGCLWHTNAANRFYAAYAAIQCSFTESQRIQNIIAVTQKSCFTHDTFRSSVVYILRYDLFGNYKCGYYKILERAVNVFNFYLLLKYAIFILDRSLIRKRLQ